MEVPIGVTARPAAGAAATGSDAGTARFAQMVDLLLTVAYIDGLLHQREHEFMAHYMESVLAQIEQSAVGSPEDRARLRAAWRAHFEELYQRLSGEISVLAQEILQAGSDGNFVPTRLRVRAVTVFRALAPQDQAMAIELIHSLVHADGVVTTGEQSLYQELSSYFHAVTHSAGAKTLTPAGEKQPPPLIVQPAVWKDLVALAHPLLDPIEQTYSPHPVERKAQIEWDYNLIQTVVNHWTRQRTTGTNKLVGITDVAQIPAGSNFLDTYVYVMRPTQPVELIVLGDLHGCYSCLKACLLQSNFIQRVWAHQWDPANHPDVKLVLLGDYIDRGLYSFDGVLRAVLHLFAAMPDNVVVLRGNHEWLRWWNNQISSGVYPAEALASIQPHVPPEMLEAYRLLFEYMPTSLLCDRTMFVHGGIPREDTFAERYTDLSSLNDNEIRFQMLWSDPAMTAHVPVELQRQNPRFTFGANQFRTFMDRVGMKTLIRGHEKIDRGFECVYDLGGQMLLNLFSAGGHDNRDLPADSSYRTVTPMALSLLFGQGPTPTLTPWPLHYQPFNYEPHNGLYRRQPVLEFKYA